MRARARASRATAAAKLLLSDPRFVRLPGPTGKADALKLNFTHVLMMASLLALIAIGSALANRADAEEAAARAAAERKPKRD